jgi:hypothetical protein
MAFYEWFDNLPDLDAIEEIKRKDSNFGLVRAISCVFWGVSNSQGCPKS